MATDTLILKVVTPDEIFFEGAVDYVMAPGVSGYLGILKNHAPLVTPIDKGELSFRDPEGKTRHFKVEGGFLEIFKNRVLLLTDKVTSLEVGTPLAA
jgi:F-type H+-transporting ATPase subunit epsilon